MKLTMIFLLLSNVRSIEKNNQGLPFCNYFYDTLQNLTDELKNYSEIDEFEPDFLDKIDEIADLFKERESKDLISEKMVQFGLDLKKKLEDIVSTLSENSQEVNNLSEETRLRLIFDEQLKEFEDFFKKELVKDSIEQLGLTKFLKDLKEKGNGLKGIFIKRYSGDVDEGQTVKNLQSEIESQIDSMIDFIDEKLKNEFQASLNFKEFGDEFEKKLDELFSNFKKNLEKEIQSSPVKIKFILEFTKQLECLEEFIKIKLARSFSNLSDMLTFQGEYEKKINELKNCLKNHLNDSLDEQEDVSKLRSELEEKLKNLEDSFEEFLVDDKISLSEIAKLGSNFKKKSDDLIQLLKSLKKTDFQNIINVKEFVSEFVKTFDHPKIFLKKSSENIQGLSGMVNTYSDFEKKLKELDEFFEKNLEEKFKTTGHITEHSSDRSDHLGREEPEPIQDKDGYLKDEPLRDEQTLNRENHRENVERITKEPSSGDDHETSEAFKLQLEQEEKIKAMKTPSQAITKSAVQGQSSAAGVEQVLTNTPKKVDPSSSQIPHGELKNLSEKESLQLKTEIMPEDAENVPSTILNDSSLKLIEKAKEGLIYSDIPRETVSSMTQPLDSIPRSPSASENIQPEQESNIDAFETNSSNILSAELQDQPIEEIESEHSNDQIKDQKNSFAQNVNSSVNELSTLNKNIKDGLQDPKSNTERKENSNLETSEFIVNNGEHKNVIPEKIMGPTAKNTSKSDKHTFLKEAQKSNKLKRNNKGQKNNARSIKSNVNLPVTSNSLSESSINYISKDKNQMGDDPGIFASKTVDSQNLNSTTDISKLKDFYLESYEHPKDFSKKPILIDHRDRIFNSKGNPHLRTKNPTYFSNIETENVSFKPEKFFSKSGLKNSTLKPINNTNLQREPLKFVDGMRKMNDHPKNFSNVDNKAQANGSQNRIILTFTISRSKQ